MIKGKKKKKHVRPNTILSNPTYNNNNNNNFKCFVSVVNPIKYQVVYLIIQKNHIWTPSNTKRNGENHILHMLHILHIFYYCGQCNQDSQKKKEIN